MTDSRPDFGKKFTYLKASLENKEYFSALRALHFARKITTGTRKDGVTPEFMHQVEMACIAQTLSRGMIYPEQVFSAIFLHDTREDKGIGQAEIEALFDAQTSKAVDLLTYKDRTGMNLPNDVYYPRIAQDPVASVVKGCDGVHNMRTMMSPFDEPINVAKPTFTLERQKQRIADCEAYWFPMMREAREIFASQRSVYQNLIMIMKMQIHYLRAIHDLMGTLREASA